MLLTEIDVRSPVGFNKEELPHEPEGKIVNINFSESTWKAGAFITYVDPDFG